MRFDKMKKINFLEFIIIFAIFVIPPLFSNEKFIAFVVPKNPYDLILFILKIIALASFEELLYRIYLPFRIESFFDSNETSLQYFKAHKGYFFCSELLPIIFFALAHRYLGLWNVVYAFAMGIIFRFIFVFMKRRFSLISAFLVVAILHSAHNFVAILASVP